MKIAITGHRPSKLGNDYDLTSPLILAIKARIMRILQEQLSDHHIILARNHSLITGMALGIDTLFAKIAIEMSIPFIAAIPCKNQWARWTKKDIELYQHILKDPLCTIHNVSTEPYNNHSMQDRNEWMVDNCDILIGVWDGTAGGTANCLKYAKEQGKPQIIITPKTLVKWENI
jgi:uncharacterized phage-like protein YoqJ